MDRANRIEVKLNDGTLVLGKMYKGEPWALTYANRTQAQRAADREGGEVIQRGRPFYVGLPQSAPKECQAKLKVDITATAGDDVRVKVTRGDEVIHQESYAFGLTGVDLQSLMDVLGFDADYTYLDHDELEAEDYAYVENEALIVEDASDDSAVMPVRYDGLAIAGGTFERGE